MIKTIQKGDLVAYSGYAGKLHVGIFTGGDNAYHFWPLRQRTLDRLAEGKKPYVEYITGSNCIERVVRVTPDVLEPEELKIYKKIKGENETTDTEKGSN